VSIEDDHASDRRFALALGGLLVVEVILAGLADAGVIALWLWLVLAIVAVLVAGLVTAVSQSRAEGTPLVGRRHRREANGS
jgi:hypothetical protein